jgi:hypothetical protein
MLVQLPPDARSLADYMSDLSEEAYCAGWMLGLEYALWRAVLLGPRTYGRLKITAEHIERLKTLSTAAGGWIAFDDALGEVLVTHDEWKQMFKKWSDANPGLAD